MQGFITCAKNSVPYFVSSKAVNTILAVSNSENLEVYVMHNLVVYVFHYTLYFSMGSVYYSLHHPHGSDDMFRINGRKENVLKENGVYYIRMSCFVLFIKQNVTLM